MARRCFIHVGHPKTATTYLQHCLHLNEALFRQHNIWLPGEFASLGFYDLVPMSRAGTVISGNLAPLFELMSTGPGDSKPAMFDYLFAAPEMPPGCDIVLSSELFFYYANAIAEVALTAARYGFKPVVIAYLPRQDRAAITGYLQNVRNHGFADGVVEFLVHNSHMGYCQYLRAMRQLQLGVPGAAILLRSFDRRFLRHGDIFEDFLHVIGSAVPPQACSRPRVAINEGLLLEQYELLRAAALMQRPDAAERLANARSTLTAEQRARVHAYYYRPYVRDFLARNYMPDNLELLQRFMPEASTEEAEYWQMTEPTTEKPTLDASLLTQFRTEALV